MDDQDKLNSSTEAEMSAPKISVNEFCLNCGTKLQDQFCHHCGQKDIPKRQTLGELWTNFISSFWSYEGKFFQTTKYILIRPGFLAIEYNKGKRESYYHPARMYVFISFVFFLLFFSLPDSDEGDEPMSQSERKELRDELKATGLDSLAIDSILNKTISEVDIADSSGFIKKKKVKKSKGLNFNFSGNKYMSAREYDSVQNTLPEAKRDGWIGQMLNRRASELNARYKNDNESFGKDFGEAFSNNFSKVLFWLLPVFAFLLKLLYIRKDYFYSEHLVFSIYYYNFFYLAASVSGLIDIVPWLDWFGIVFFLWIFLYLLFAMKRMYEHRWGKTILKFSLFVISFLMMLLVGIAINVMATLFFI